MDIKNGVIERLKEFAESKGGVSEVARTIGKNPVTFYNLISRNAKPSVDTLIEIAAVYPDVDLDYIIRGEYTNIDVLIDESLLDKRIKDLEEENRQLKLSVERYEFIIDAIRKAGA